jgi:CheY-like chemotaxis protein
MRSGLRSLPVAKILIVDDDQDTRQLLKIRLEAKGYQTAFAWDAVTAISATREERPEPSATEQRALSGGAVAYVQKPIDNEQLLGASRTAVGEE